MTIEEYIENRLDDQIKWYSKKAGFYKNFYYAFNIAIAILSSSSVIFTTLSLKIESYSTTFSIIALICSSSIPVVIAVNGIMKCQELYKNYRSTCEMLKREKILFQNNTGEYENASNSEKLLVRRCESIMSTETNNWVQLNEKKD